jgi:hypothetical protein
MGGRGTDRGEEEMGSTVKPSLHGLEAEGAGGLQGVVLDGASKKNKAQPEPWRAEPRRPRLQADRGAASKGSGVGWVGAGNGRGGWGGAGG